MQREWRRGWLAALAAALVLGSGASGAEPAEGRWTSFEFGFWEDFQLFGPDFAVRGLRVNLGATENREVTGIDLFGLGNLTSGDQVGWQNGFYNRVGGDLVGLQLGVIASEVAGRTRGLQVATLYNRAEESGGVQLAAFLNRVKRARGLQIALWNDAHDLAGVQIGLVNVYRNGWLPVLPLLNFGPLRRASDPSGDPDPSGGDPSSED